MLFFGIFVWVFLWVVAHCQNIKLLNPEMHSRLSSNLYQPLPQPITHKKPHSPHWFHLLTHPNLLKAFLKIIKPYLSPFQTSLQTKLLIPQLQLRSHLLMFLKHKINHPIKIARTNKKRPTTKLLLYNNL